jgi:ATP-dependent DNA helicase RecG
MTSRERHALALAALDLVKAGSTADEAETDFVDFKEESGTVAPGGTRVPVDPRHEPAASSLANEVACLANSDQGGVLVVGVHDKSRGTAALVGTHLDLEWLRRRIHALTQPNYNVEVEELVYEGTRLYLIDVPPALEEVRAGGKLRTRINKACVELSGDRAREFLERRRGYDWSAGPSGKFLSDVSPAAFASAREKYQAAKGLAPESNLELCRRMGVLVGNGDEPDPELKVAGAVLLTRFEPDVEQLVVLVSDAEGLQSRHSLRGPAPMLLLFDDAWRLITGDAFPERHAVVGTVRRLVRAVPDQAVREALANAIMHRDYRIPSRPITVHALGGDTLKVRSPGGFVTGVNAQRLISAPSVARNPTLAEALRTIGLAEREGIGVDTMYSQMLRAGHKQPEIYEDSGDVVVGLYGGKPDTALVGFFEDVSQRDARLDDVRTAMAVTALLVDTPLRAEALSDAAQCTREEALQTLNRLEDLGVVTRLVNRSRAFSFSDSTKARFSSRLQYRSRRKLEQHLELITAFLDTAPQISREETADLLGVAPNYASKILSGLLRSESLTTVANARGAGVRYRLPD